MRALRSLVVVFVVGLLSTSAVAQVLDAPTGLYKGTLVHERRLTLKQSDPPRVVAAKHKTKVIGFGYVPQGGTRTFIRLIVPPGASLDRGLDRQLTVDFTPDPPAFEILDGLNATPFPFPTISVEGNVVTVRTGTGVNTADYEITEVNTLTLKHKP